MLHGLRDKALAHRVAEDISAVSPETTVRQHEIEFGDPWDFERVYETLFNFVWIPRHGGQDSEMIRVGIPK